MRTLQRNSTDRHGREGTWRVLLQHFAHSPALSSFFCERMVPCMRSPGAASGRGGGTEVLACGNCHVALRKDYMCPHACPDSKWIRVPPDLVPTAPGSHRCLLCGKLASSTEAHPCRGLSRVVYDVSNLPVHGDTSRWTRSELDKVREFSNGIFVHACVINGHVLCHPLLVAPSSVPGAGSGAYTLLGLDKNCKLEYADESRLATTWTATPSKGVLGIYNGEEVPEATADEGRLAALKTQSGVTLDPQRHGSVLVKLNCKHGTAANVVTVDMPVVQGSDATRPVMLPLTQVAPGDELFWDYRSEAAPGSSNPVCSCKGKGGSVKLPLLEGDIVDLDACPGTLYNVPKRRKTAKS